jgi:hypothetical protein
VTDGCALGLRLLRDAVNRADEEDLDYALAVCFTFGLTADHLEWLVRLASADWHRKHEDVATALGKLRMAAPAGSDCGPPPGHENVSDTAVSSHAADLR